MVVNFRRIAVCENLGMCNVIRNQTSLNIGKKALPIANHIMRNELSHSLDRAGKFILSRLKAK